MHESDLWGWWEPEDWLPTFATGSPPAAAGPPTPPTPFPSAAADLSTELLLAGVWTDITSQVYERDKVEITRGRANEASLVEPSRCGLTLNNRNGQFSPRNPRSAYHGLIGRNTPLRVSNRPHLQTGPIPDIADTFTRTVPDTNWGICDSGKSWPAIDLFTPVGARTQPSVNGSTGIMAIQINSQVNGVYLAECEWVDFDVAVTFTAPVPTGGDICGAGIVSHVAADGSTTGPYVEVVVTRVAGQVIIRGFTAARFGLGDSGFVAGLVHIGQPLRCRIRTAGLHLLARVWDPAGAEPAVWHLAVADATAYDPGGLAVYARALAGNTNAKPLVVAFDDLAVEAVEPRACGEVAAWPARWTEGGQDVWTPVEATGILRRLGQGKGRASSPMVRLILNEAANGFGPPSAYWPLEDGRLSTEGAPLFGTAPMQVFPRGPGVGLTVVSPDQYLGAGSLAPWLPPALALHGIDGTLGAVNMPTFASNGWAVDWIRAGVGDPALTEFNMIIYSGAPTTGAPFGSQQWTIATDPSPGSVTISTPGAGGSTAISPLLFDGSLHHWRFQALQNGIDVDWALHIDGVSVLAGTVAALGLASVRLINPQDILEHHDTNLAIGHIVAWDRAPDLFGFGRTPTAVQAAAAALGHDGEPAAVRIARLCAEEGITLRIPGPPGQDLTGSYPCGVQRTVPVLELLRAAEATDGGVLYEPRDFVGLAYRMRTQMHSQAPQVTLDYPAAGNVAHPLDPAPDDAATRNDVTISRRFGQSAQIELATGPLSVQAPPAGVGRYDTSTDLDLATDAAALQQAAWRLHLGTVDEDRFPKINVNLSNTAAHNLPLLLAQVMRADVGDRLTIARPPSWLPPGAIDQLVQGYAETLDAYRWLWGANCSPASPWAVATVESGDEFCWRLETDGSSLAAGAGPADVTLSVASTGILWTTSAAYPADFPFDIAISGVRITVTGIAGTSSPQTFTVVRSVDGFDVALASGAAVTLWRRTYLGLG